MDQWNFDMTHLHCSLHIYHYHLISSAILFKLIKYNSIKLKQDGLAVVPCGNVVGSSSVTGAGERAPTTGTADQPTLLKPASVLLQICKNLFKITFPWEHAQSSPCIIMVLCDRIHLFIVHKNKKLIMCWNSVNEAESCITVTDAALLALVCCRWIRYFFYYKCFSDWLQRRHW